MLVIVLSGIFYTETEKQTFIATVSYDTYGYYLYLPAFFIYKDPVHLRFIPEITERYPFLTNYFYQARLADNGNYVMNYTSGLALLYLPFFLIGHIAAKLASYPADGFSLPYQLAIFWGGILCAIAGAIFLMKVLIRFFDDKVTAVVLAVVLLGSNYFYYAAVENAMPHNYIFTLYAVLLYACMKWHERHRMKFSLMMALSIGLAILIRPTEILVVIVPLLWGVYNFDTLKIKFSLLLQYRWQIVVMVLIIGAIGCIQLAYWKYASGKWLYYSYAENLHLDFKHPHIISGLFSFRKGWFIHTPLMMLAFPALFITYGRMKEIFLAIFAFTILHIYIIFSWPVWWYGGSFGCRPMIHAYPLLAISFGALFAYFFRSKFKIPIYWLAAAVISFLIFLNLFQSWQYANKFFSPEGLNSYVYKLTFLKTKITRKTIYEYQGLQDPEKFKMAKWKLLATNDFENPEIANSDTNRFAGSYGLQLSDEAPDYEVFTAPVKDIKIYRISFHGFFDHYVYKEKNFAALKLKFYKDGKPLSARQARLNNLTGNDVIREEPDYFGKPNIWYPLQFCFSVPAGADSLRMSFHCSGCGNYYVDDLVIEASGY